MIDIIIAKIPGGYKIKHYNNYSGLPEIMRYYDYTLTQAIQQHRKIYSLQRKHLHKIFI